MVKSETLISGFEKQGKESVLKRMLMNRTYMLHTVLAQNGNGWYSQFEGAEYRLASTEGQLQNELKLSGNERNL
jgi:hypothetical protein